MLNQNLYRDILHPRGRFDGFMVLCPTYRFSNVQKIAREQARMEWQVKPDLSCFHCEIKGVLQ